jgi:DNA-binding transcriptional LysR family regulator
MGRMRVTLEKLRYFVVLVEELNFTRAAERVYLSQQAFSAHIRQLESMLGMTLFDRTTRATSLTPSGERLLEPVREALAMLRTGIDEARALGSVRSSLRLGGFLEAGRLGSPALAAFAVAHPDVSIEMHQLRWDNPSWRLQDWDVDVAFVRLPLDTKGLTVRELFSEPLVLLVSKKNPLAGQGEVTLEEAFAEPLILARNTPPEWNDFWLLRGPGGEPPRFIAATGNKFEEIEMVAAGLASTFLPESLAGAFTHHPEIRLLPITGSPLTTVALAWRDGSLSDAAQAFIETVEEVVFRLGYSAIRPS